MVPKLIARDVHTEGWRVETQRNLTYGAEVKAPMVTWVINLTWDHSAAATPNATYCDALAHILACAGTVTESGEICGFLE
jgi:hypothetical protein